jgi:hypothetical protein
MTETTKILSAASHDALTAVLHPGARRLAQAVRVEPEERLAA